MDLRPIPEYRGKYWISRTGIVRRSDGKGTMHNVSVSGSPSRVRTYWNGQESRRLVKHIVAEVWGAEAAAAYERRTESDVEE